MDVKIAPDKTCRVCLSESSQLKSMCAKTEDPTNSILESLHFVANIKFLVEDRLPNQICNNCESDLYAAEAFKRRSLNSEIILCEQFQLSNRNEIIEELSRKPVKEEGLENSTIQAKAIDIVVIQESPPKVEEVKNEPDSESFEPDFEEPLENSCTNDTIYLPQPDAIIPEPPISHQKRKLRSKGQKKRDTLNKIKKGKATEESEKEELDVDVTPERHICPTCKKEYKMPWNLEIHILDVHIRGNRKDLTYDCEICKEPFPKLRLLKKHRKIHQEDAFTHICPICGKIVRDMYTLNTHMRRHNGEKPYPCDHCDNRFVTKMELNQHRRIHNNEMPYACEFCGRKFRTSCTLKRHRRIHTGERPYKCEMCPKAFAEPGSRNHHMRIHTGEKPFQCSHCGHKFTRRHHLKRHLKQHEAVRSGRPRLPKSLLACASPDETLASTPGT